jgi:hypothetical protein
MKRRGAIGILLAFALAPRLAFVQAQGSEQIHCVAFVATTSPLVELSGADPASPFARAFVHGLRGVVDRRLQLARSRIRRRKTGTLGGPLVPEG